jgi:hypothetical protein
VNGITRLSDVIPTPTPAQLPALPVVDWRRIDRTMPTVIPAAYEGPAAPMPSADVVVLTWTMAEWSALDQVFVGSTTPRQQLATDWQSSWHLYSRNAPNIPEVPAVAPLWGFYKLVEVMGAAGAQRVLLFKCDSHLAHPPWFAGLVQMLETILADVEPTTIYTIGTAGASRPEIRLGDVVITNAGYIELQDPNNAGAPFRDRAVTCRGRFPALAALPTAQAELFFPLERIVTFPLLQAMFTDLGQQLPIAPNLRLDDLLNDALSPTTVAGSKGLPMPGTPLLTTDFYYIADTPDSQQWAALEMDDAVVGYVADSHDVDFVFVRNISDPVVPFQAMDGSALPPDVRQAWSSEVYEMFGLYTSFNGALATWAALGT